MRRSPLACILTAIAALAVVAPAASAATPAATVTCDRVAAPNGDDGAAGTLAAPYRSARKLVGALTSGQVGCLRSGTYSENVAIAHAGITLTSYPGETASVVGRFWVQQGADGVTVSSLKLDAVTSSLPSPTVNGNDALFVGNDVTSQRRQICFDIGNADTWGRAQRTVIRGNRIHDCGAAGTNQIHGIYVVAADDTQILDNVIYDNADRGIQLYPDAQRTIVRGNIIDGNGEGIIFSGDDGTASSGNVVERNIISNSRIRTNVESWYPEGNPIGRGNVVRDNCLWKGATGSTDVSGGGFALSANTTADPRFVDRASGDFRLAAGSACAATLGTSAAPAGLAGQAPVDGTAPVATTPASTTPASSTPAAPTVTTTPTATTSTTPASAPRTPVAGTTWTPTASTASAPTAPSASTGVAKPAATHPSTHRVCRTVQIAKHRWVRRCQTSATAARVLTTHAARKASAARAAKVQRARIAAARRARAAARRR